MSDYSELKSIAEKAPKVVEWDGVGFPPAGVVCEYRKTDAKYRQGFVAVSVLCHGKEKCFLQHEASKNEFTEGISFVEFRPARTAEQLAEEERDKARTEVLNAMTSKTMGFETKDQWQQRMKVVGEMLDMGYRKQ